MKATSEPTDMAPLSMRWPPNQMTAMLDAFTTSIIVGNISAIRRPAFSDVSVRSCVDRVEALRLHGLAHERAHDAHARRSARAARR